MRTVFVCELRKLCRNSSFLLFGALLLLASVLYPFGRALAPDANGVNLLKKQAVFAAYPDSTPAEAAADLAARQDALDVSVALLMLQQAPNQTVRDMALRMLADRGYTAEDLPALREAGALRFGSSIAQERVIWLMQGDTAAVLDAPVLATALTCLALTILLFGLGEYRWLKALDKPNF